MLGKLHVKLIYLGVTCCFSVLLRNCPHRCTMGFLFCYFKIYFYLLMFREGEGKENNQPSLTCHQPGTWPAIQARALTGNWASDPVVCRRMPIPLSHTSQGAPRGSLIAWMGSFLLWFICLSLLCNEEGGCKGLCCLEVLQVKCTPLLRSGILGKSCLLCDHTTTPSSVINWDLLLHPEAPLPYSLPLTHCCLSCVLPASERAH